MDLLGLIRPNRDFSIGYSGNPSSHFLRPGDLQDAGDRSGQWAEVYTLTHWFGEKALAVWADLDSA
jgi:hypothetical protein